MGYKRLISEVSSSLSSTDSSLSQSLFSQTFSGSGPSALTYTFQKTLQTIRMDITSTAPGKVNFMLTPNGIGGFAKVEKVVFWGEGCNLPATMTMGYRKDGTPYNITNGSWTGTMPDGDSAEGFMQFDYATASLHPNIGNLIIPTGTICHVTSSAGPFALQIFYRTEE